MSDADAIDAIQKVKSQHLYFLDTKDWAALRGVFTDDAVMDASAQFPDDPDPSVHVIAGADRIVKGISRFLGDTATAHLAANPIVTLEGENEATGIWGMTDHLFMADGRRMIGFGHYEDRFLWSGGRWLIARTKVHRTKVLYLPAGA